MIDLNPIPIDFNHYDELILATPVWAKRPSAPMYSFIKKQMFKGKQISIITTSGGSDSGAIDYLVEELKGNTIKSTYNIPFPTPFFKLSEEDKAIPVNRINEL